jgi:hypothetical protein
MHIIPADTSDDFQTTSILLAFQPWSFIDSLLL